MTAAPRFGDLAIPASDAYWLRRARVPSSLLAGGGTGHDVDAEGSRLVDILVASGRVAEVAPAGEAAGDGAPGLDLGARQVWPALVDMHTHLNKSHSHARSPNLDGSFLGARQAVTVDREYWTLEDTQARMDFALRCAYVHGVAAVRTHLESRPEMADITWRAFAALRDRWAGRIELQGVSIMPIELFEGKYGIELADRVAASGGILGAVTRPTFAGVQDGMLDSADELLDRVFRLAAERGLNVDLHVDESGDVQSAVLPRVAAATLRHGYEGRVVCGHCCSLALQPEPVLRSTLELCARAGVAIVTLPTANLFLQDRTPGRTPRWRGGTVVHELRSAGVKVAIAGDNCRDSFFPYGDNDMVETLQQGIRILHLDPELGEAVAMAAPIPAQIIGARDLGVVGKGKPARLVIFSGRTINEVMSRPHAGRIVLDRGARVSEELPDYAELDDLNRAAPGKAR